MRHVNDPSEPAPASYPVLLAGAPAEGRSWVHWPRSSAVLTDTYETVALKARLDRGRARPGDHTDPRLAGRVARSTDEQALAALAAARAAQPAWARVPLDRRLDLVRAFHDLLRERADDLLAVLVAEGSPLRVARWALGAALDLTHPDSVAYARSAMRWEGRQYGRTVRLVRKPDGVVCLDPARNAPLLTSLSAVPALAAGNAVVLNVPPAVPLSTAYVFHELIAPLLAEYGAPPGTLSVLCAPARPMLRTWLDSPHCDDIYFFGGSAEGAALTRSCLEHGKKPIMELAGNDALVVWRDADLGGAVEAALERYFASGQLCLAPKFAVVHPEVADAFTERLLREVAALRVGPPEDPGVVLTPVVKRTDFRETLDEAVAGGARLLCGGDPVDVHGRPSPRGPFVRPALLRVQGLGTAATLTAVTEETFFPLMCVVVPGHEETAGAPGTPRTPGTSGPPADRPTAADDEALLTAVLAFVQANRYGLRNSLWARDPHVIHRFTDEVTNGGVLKVNDSHIGTLPVLPIVGGTGLSGGVFGEANISFLRTTRLQGIGLGAGAAAPFDHLASAGTLPGPGTAPAPRVPAPGGPGAGRKADT